LFARAFSPQVVLFPGTVNLYLAPKERENLYNVNKLRDLFFQKVEKRRALMKESTYVEKGDLLSILLQDDLFKNDDVGLVDECMLFFIAGS